MKNYKEVKAEVISKFYSLLDDARNLIAKISEGNEIELEKNGVVFVMLDPFSDGDDLCDVERVKDGVIYLTNGSEVDVSDVTNLTDLIGLIETIDE